MIERLLAAEAALDAGDLDTAERIYDQVAAADPHNAIAVVGLARVAHRRGHDDAARELAERALSIDPDEAAATRLLAELTAEGPAEPAPAPPPSPAPAPSPAPGPPAPAMAAPSTPASEPQPAARPSTLGRLTAWLRSLLRRRA